MSSLSVLIVVLMNFTVVVLRLRIESTNGKRNVTSKTARVLLFCSYHIFGQSYLFTPKRPLKLKNGPVFQSRNIQQKSVYTICYTLGFLLCNQL